MAFVMGISRMYDTFLSPQWILDFCFVANAFAIPIMGLSGLIAGVLIFVFLKKNVNIDTNIKRVILIVSSAVVGVVSFFVTGFLMMIVGFLVVGCSYGPFWRAVYPAHKLHALLKNHITNTGIPPADIEELKKLDSLTFSVIEQNAKIKYIYSPDQNRYTFFVRPNRFLIAVFDSEVDYGAYHLVGIIGDIGFSKYPPSIPGPWDQLPE